MQVEVDIDSTSRKVALSVTDKEFEVEPEVKPFVRPSAEQLAEIGENLARSNSAIKPVNNAFKFIPPTSQAGIDAHIVNFYKRNTHLSKLDTEADPNTFKDLDGPGLVDDRTPEDHILVKEIKNVHICSDHQRAYVWLLCWP